MQRFIGLASIVLASCGGRLDLTSDAAVDATLDAPTDAALDGGIDGTPPPPFAGSFSVVEANLLMPGTTTSFGQGLQASIVFTDGSMLPAPLMEENPGLPVGCKVWEYTPAQALHAAVGIDEGPVTLTFASGSNPATPPVVPPCAFLAGTGYGCSDFSTGSTGGVITGGANGTATLNDVDVTYTAANSLGRYVKILGAATPANDGRFPIVGITPPSTITYFNPARVTELLPGGASHINVAAAGPIPGIVDPGFLADDVALTFSHVAGGGNHIPAFTLMTTGPGHLGDDFTLEPASLALLTHVPRTGEELVFACATNCGADSAAGSLVDLVTTDAPVAGLSPFALPPPVAKRVQVRCARLGPGPVTIPAAYSVKLMTAGATRVQATFIRGAVLAWPDPPVTGVAGHAIVAVTTFP